MMWDSPREPTDVTADLDACVGRLHGRGRRDLHELGRGPLRGRQGRRGPLRGLQGRRKPLRGRSSSLGLGLDRRLSKRFCTCVDFFDCIGQRCQVLLGFVLPGRRVLHVGRHLKFFAVCSFGVLRIPWTRT